jgi:NADH:ubiquinone oxidoreductase subunit 2 (subunit N)
MKWIKELFDDNNTINEKSVVGFIAFFMMVIALGVDIFTGFAGKEFVINEFIFDGFMVIVLGSFGIGSIDKFINAKKGNKSEETPTEE